MYNLNSLDSIFTDSIETLELETSFDDLEVITSFYSGFIFSVKTVSDTFKIQLAPSIRPQKLWCKARALLSPVSLATMMSASKLIQYFSNHPQAFRYWFSTPPDNITLNPANRKADQNLSEFQTGIGAAVHTTLDTELLISHTRDADVDTISSLQDSEGGVISVSEAHKSLSQDS